MIDVLLIVIGPPVIVFMILAALPTWRSYLIGWMVFGLAFALAAFFIFPLGPRMGPDDWFHGIEQVPFWGALATALITLPAQLWRAHCRRVGRKPYYLLVLLPSAFALLFSASLFFA